MRARGHSISWIVQNPVYRPRKAIKSGDNICELPFPSRRTLPSQCEIPRELSRDRGRIYFGSGSAHYDHYQNVISAALDKLQPDIVIGEPTLFHELITLRNCNTRNIPYLHPTMNRYPNGRFTVFKGNTQLPARQGTEQLPENDARNYAASIGNGKTTPSYMHHPSKKERIRRQISRFISLVQVWVGRLRGEKYNTPSLRNKRAMTRTLKRNLAIWRHCAQSTCPTQKAILYPLQMQPEANIDVWGYPWSDQLETIRAMLEHTPEDVSVLIKANPKSKYELAEQLLALADKTERMILLPLEMTMLDAQNLSLGSLTVSGTVGLEAVFGKGRCLSLRHPILQSKFPEFHAPNIREAMYRLLNVPSDGVGSVNKGTQLMQEFTASSFSGTINEPLYHPACVSPENTSKVADALELVFDHVLKQDDAI